MPFNTFLLVFFVTLFSTSHLFSQCVPDDSFVPINTNYGLSPDTLIDGVVSQSYFQELTFYLPLDTLVELDGIGETLIQFEDYHITSISLPVGLSWECNSSDNDCHYNPTISQYGCVTLSGTPLVSGEFDVSVTVIATHELSWAVGTETITFDLPLTILPNLSQNAGFSMANFSGCAPLIVEFVNNNSGLESYNWMFGNGNMSASENPPPQLYSQPGIYEVSYTAYSSLDITYFLTGVEVNSAEGWDDDADDGFGFLSPDPYFKLFDSSGTLILQTAALVDNSFPVSWNVDNLILSNANYTIEVWDEDGPLTDDDNLGSVTFNGNTSSTTLSNGSLVVSISVNQIEPIPFAQVVDTVFVFESPSMPQISYDEMSNNLSLNSDSSSLSYQWYYNQSPILGANTTSYQPINTGYYSLLVTNDSGCSEFSDEELVVICNTDFAPEIMLSSDTLYAESYLNYDHQWMYYDEPIADATDDFYVAGQSGTFSLILTDEWGCEFKSNSIDFSLITVSQFEVNTFAIYPNPTAGLISVQMLEPVPSYIVSLVDVQGRELIRERHTDTTVQFDFSQLEKGVYFLTVHMESRQVIQKIILN